MYISWELSSSYRSLLLCPLRVLTFKTIWLRQVLLQWLWFINRFLSPRCGYVARLEILLLKAWVLSEGGWWSLCMPLVMNQGSGWSSVPKLEKAVADIQSASSSQRIVVWPYSKGCSLLESCTLTVPQQHGWDRSWHLHRVSCSVSFSAPHRYLDLPFSPH